MLLDLAVCAIAVYHAYKLHDDIIKWKHFPRYWAFVRGIHRSPVNSPHKGQWRGVLMFSLHLRLRLRQNKRYSKQWWDWWFETPSHPLWCHCNVTLHVHYFQRIIATLWRTTIRQMVNGIMMKNYLSFNFDLLIRWVIDAWLELWPDTSIVIEVSATWMWSNLIDKY